MKNKRKIVGSISVVLEKDGELTADITYTDFLKNYCDAVESVLKRHSLEIMREIFAKEGAEIVEKREAVRAEKPFIITPEGGGNEL